MKSLGNVHKYVSRMLALQNFCLTKEIYFMFPAFLEFTQFEWKAAGNGT